eukprot:1157509-Pelagomonas_calceolata.AAC.12
MEDALVQCLAGDHAQHMTRGELEELEKLIAACLCSMSLRPTVSCPVPPASLCLAFPAWLDVLLPRDLMPLRLNITSATPNPDALRGQPHATCGTKLLHAWPHRLKGLNPNRKCLPASPVPEAQTAKRNM